MTELLQGARSDALDTLAERIAGDVYRPGDDGWDEARTAWNLAVDQRGGSWLRSRRGTRVVTT